MCVCVCVYVFVLCVVCGVRVHVRVLPTENVERGRRAPMSALQIPSHSSSSVQRGVDKARTHNGKEVFACVDISAAVCLGDKRKPHDLHCVLCREKCIPVHVYASYGCCGVASYH